VYTILLWPLENLIGSQWATARMLEWNIGPHDNWNVNALVKG